MTVFSAFYFQELKTWIMLYLVPCLLHLIHSLYRLSPNQTFSFSQICQDHSSKSFCLYCVFLKCCSPWFLCGCTCSFPSGFLLPVYDLPISPALSLLPITLFFFFSTPSWSWCPCQFSSPSPVFLHLFLQPSSPPHSLPFNSTPSSFFSHSLTSFTPPGSSLAHSNFFQNDEMAS